MVERKTDQEEEIYKFEQLVVFFEESIETKVRAAKSLLSSLITLAQKQEVFPQQEFVYRPDRVGSLVAQPKNENALLFDFEAQHHGRSRFIMLMGDGSMVRFFERRHLPRKNDEKQRIHYDGDQREELTDYEYVIRTPYAARTILSLISK